MVADREMSVMGLIFANDVAFAKPLVAAAGTSLRSAPTQDGSPRSRPT